MLIFIIKIAPTEKEKQNQKKPPKSPKHITEATETLFLKMRELILTAVTYNTNFLWTAWVLHSIAVTERIKLRNVFFQFAYSVDLTAFCIQSFPSF